jgi:glucose 1-dehydrogenase
MVERKQGGRIVVISSVHSFIPFPGSLAYNTAKAGINQMAYTMATELAPHRVLVNVIDPGWIDTPGERKAMSHEALMEAGRKLLLGRMGRPDEIGKMAAYLASGAADYITGSCFRVDGGFALPGGYQL